jgi:tetratricopeptide (TPR) repeat protein
MAGRKWTLLSLLVLAGVSLVSAEEPPYKRLLQGDDAKKAEALQKRIDELWTAAKFAEAVVPAEELLAVRQRVQGDGHWEVADATRRLQTLRQAARLPAAKQQALAETLPLEAKAQELQAQGKYPQAEPFYRKALAVKEELLGPKHPDTATTYFNLAVNLLTQGRALEADPLHRKALAVREEILGPRHPNTAESYNDLALTLQAQGLANEAEPLYRKALAIAEEVLGPRHRDTATCYETLAYNLDAQGRSNEAEPLCRKALALREETLGPKHPHTAMGYNNLAINLHRQGRIQEAEPLFRRALAVQEEVLGPKHPDTARSYNNLAANLNVQGRVREGEPLLRQALAIYEEVLGPRHPGTAMSCNNLAYNLNGQGRFPEAEPLYRQALAICQEVQGPKHPNTAISCINLAINLQGQGRVVEAEALQRKALAIREEVLGPKHPDTATSYNHLAVNLDAQGRARDADPLWQAAADGVEAARLRLAGSTFDRAKAVHIQPHLGLAACRARLDRPADAWVAAEAGLARGLLDDLAARTALPADPEAETRDRQRAARLDALGRLLTPLLTKAKLNDEQQRRRDELLRERTSLDTEAATVAAERSRRAVLPLADVQAALAADAALLFWVDVPKSGDHWGCVVRQRGQPAWVRLHGSGPKNTWTDADAKLPRRLRDDLARGESDVDRRAHALAAQRLDPLARHFEPEGDLPAVRRLIVVPVGVMAGVPVEVLTDKYLLSYAPSGSVFARLRAKHRLLAEPTLLALGDPNFTLPSAAKVPEPPDYGLYLSVVLPDGNAARAGLRAGDVLLRYAGRKLTTKADLKAAEAGEPVPIVVWRDGNTLDELRLAPGKLGVAISDDPPAIALRQRRELDLLADARTRSDIRPLPGTRLEVAALAGLLPEGQSRLLLSSQASEQQLDALAASGKLKSFRLLHLATHGGVDPVSAAHSALELARDQLPGPDEQTRLAAAGRKVPTGRLSVETIAKDWELDADLVTLSACETALGPEGGGEGLLGFSQVLLGKGARSLLLSLWKVDDTATALLMTRFYENLLGKREGLDNPLPKAEALREAKRWLRTLPRPEVEKLASRLAKGELRAKEEPKGPPLPEPELPRGDTPFAHPRYWAAFILIGDPE